MFSNIKNVMKKWEIDSNKNPQVYFRFVINPALFHLYAAPGY